MYFVPQGYILLEYLFHVRLPRTAILLLLQPSLWPIPEELGLHVASSSMVDACEYLTYVFQKGKLIHTKCVFALADTSRLSDATTVEIPHLAGLRPAFLALHIVGGLVGLPVLIITLVFSKKVPRQPALINFCITWVINSVSYTLL